MDNDVPPLPKPPPPAPPATPLEYRPLGSEPKPQWVTDDQPGGGWLVAGLLVASGLVAVGSAVLGVLFMISGC